MIELVVVLFSFLALATMGWFCYHMLMESERQKQHLLSYAREERREYNEIIANTIASVGKSVGDSIRASLGYSDTSVKEEILAETLDLMGEDFGPTIIPDGEFDPLWQPNEYELLMSEEKFPEGATSEPGPVED